jgi:hypothetical protein
MSKSRICTNKNEELSILSFIEESNDMHSMINPNFEDAINGNELTSFQDAFSMIAKPNAMSKFPIKKTQFVELDIDLDD